MKQLCELRRVKCHSCNDIRREMDTVKVNLAAMNVKLHRNEKVFNENFKGNEQNVKAVERNLAAKVELVQQQLNKQEESNRQLKADNAEIKKNLNRILKQLEIMIQQTAPEVDTEEMKKGIAEGGEKDREPMVIVAGGWNKEGKLNSVEMFSLANRTWTRIQPMREGREGPSSVVYNNQLFVLGGGVSSIEELSLTAVQGHQSVWWEILRAELPERWNKHCSVVHNGQLIVVGGSDVDNLSNSDRITEISLVPPHTRKLLATMPQKRCGHGVALFGDKILIVGGTKSVWGYCVLRSVVMYDITKKVCQQLTPLPYAVHEMATVKWGDDNVIIMGGVDSNGKRLNKVLMYNIKTQKSHDLPNMKYKRQGCVAAVVRDNVIVMGGEDERENDLKSVEGFRFDRNSWEVLPSMHEARSNATAAVC